MTQGFEGTAAHVSTGEELFFSAAKLVFGFTVLQACTAQTVEIVKNAEERADQEHGPTA